MINVNRHEKLKSLVKLAREKSPFYRELYRDVDIEKFQLENLLIVDQEKFWAANTVCNNQLLTGKVEDGIVLKSGGTTGHPKFSVYTKSEWEMFTKIFGEGLDQSNLANGDRVANLFYSGELYASFIFIMKSLEYAKTPVIHYPITGKCPDSSLLEMIQDLNINVLAGVPTSFMHLASLVRGKNFKLPVEKILYGGEGLYQDQREVLEDCFPNVTISSIGYASVDGGHLGYVDKTCLPGEHACFNQYSIMELLDENTNEPIEKNGVVGKLVYTNLERTLMPIIRYPVGDLAKWTKVGEKFLLQGRSEVGARVGPVTVNRDDFSDILKSYPRKNLIMGFQVIIEHENKKDFLIWRIASDSGNVELLRQDQELLYQLFSKEKKMYKESVEMGLIGDIQIQICGYEDLVRNRRTGKLRNVVDRRN
ncbi:MAG: hypothetical protein A2381_13105 [Bdellovibrionales bacterium RIFOXYB1_FULL_37_110]|nr:MAG: hypothetical protein A2181_02430 [Bdellovibrionales bacterium RIFOXYA1_FULL_38_20]OFZ51644.1 MAG: hypothetical protein A2417_12765 [Bdellovibrionales bacterium RIFOXYC1_FULL_37_79]OFZ53947.1 MAG: hypothetical protein A2328_04430 [Bdellovibrionales bacterium RIFOXYB2_FULL_36_6]OFZ60471.1 MAG: hypothetical protein A2381_13105 [Bdellovibrionales bacterium RIFOXYB1_FULL_37_110]OFZ65045.1 MAG: hypothetical protein A2577_09370 [Bdellovibrionales bacterium RIFOXYD1_FULL_36_51]